jgi:hypothetical protein
MKKVFLIGLLLIIIALAAGYYLYMHWSIPIPAGASGISTSTQNQVKSSGVTKEVTYGYPSIPFKVQGQKITIPSRYSFILPEGYSLTQKEGATHNWSALILNNSGRTFASINCPSAFEEHETVNVSSSSMHRDIKHGSDVGTVSYSESASASNTSIIWYGSVSVNPTSDKDYFDDCTIQANSADAKTSLTNSELETLKQIYNSFTYGT